MTSSRARTLRVVGGRASFVALACAVVVAAGGLSSAGATTPKPVALEQLIGQRLVVAIRGTSPGARLLARVRTGQVGGVILFGFNIRR